MKKHLLWILPLLALLLVGAVVLLLLPGSQPAAPQTDPTTAPQESPIQIYWNVEGTKYIDENNQSTRTRSGDYYRALFAKDGEQMNLFFENSSMLAYADTMLFVGLEVNDENIVTAVHDPEDFTGGLAAYEYYVQSFTDTEILCNSVGSFRGLPLTLRITENTGIYWAGDADALTGLTGQLQVGSMIYALKNNTGYTTHIYVAPPFEPSPVYWNVERMWDSTTKLSSRTPDAIGYYVYTFAVNGEHKELRTNDFQVACQIDGFAAKCMHLEFDEDGLITKAVHAKNATGGNTLASWYHVTNLNELENQFTAEKRSGSDKGSVVTGTMSPNCKIFDVSGRGAFIGEPVSEIRLEDQIHCLRDPYGDVSVIFIIARQVDSPIYWNVERMWDSKAKVSTRQPDSNGWYEFLLAVNGQQVTLRTKDVKIVNSIDGRAARCFALDVDGNEIKAYFLPTATATGITFASWCDVTSISGNKVTAKRITSGSDQGTIYEAEMAPDCKVYDTTGKSGFKGIETTLRLGDRIHGLKDKNGFIRIIYVVERMNPGPIYWNLDRNYDSTNKVTRRKPDADGYYWFKLSKGTETLTFKTNSKAIANELDSYVAAGLTLRGDTIVDCYKYSTIKDGVGGGFASWTKVAALSGTKVTAGGKTASMAYGCKVYDVTQKSGAPVTETQLQVGDRIHGILNSDKQLTAVYVVERPVVSPVYWNLDRSYDTANKVTKRTPDADGYYVFKLAEGTNTVTVKTKNQAIANTLDSYVAVGLKLQGDEVLKVWKYSSIQGYGDGFASWTKVTALDGSTVTAGKYTGTLAENYKVYLVQGGSAVPVEETKLLLQDRIHGITDSNGKIALIYVVERPVISPVYWNLDKISNYDTANKVTKRTPDADGYYVFAMAEGTNTVTAKTKSKALADTLDSYVAAGMELQGDVIVKVWKYSSIQGYGDGFASWTKVTAIDDSTVTAGKYTGTMAQSCKVYLVSKGSSAPVKETSLQVGNRIHGITDSKGNIVLIYVVERVEVREGLCAACGTEVTWNSWNGTAALETGHYYLEEDITISKAASIGKDKTVCLDLNGKAVTGAKSLDRIFNIFGNFNLMDSPGSGTVTATYDNPEGRTGSVFYVQNTNGYGVFKLYSGTLAATGQTKQGGIGGIANEFYMYGGTIEGGTAAVAGGTLYMENSKEAALYMYGGTIKAGTAPTASGIRGSGKITLGGTAQIVELYLLKDRTVEVSSKTPLEETAKIGISMAQPGVFAEALTGNLSGFFASVNENFEVLYLEGDQALTLKRKPHTDHCVCGKLAENTGDHTCATLSGWTELTSESFTTSGNYLRLADGNYYLKANLELTKSIELLPDQNVTICLNGFSISGSTRVFRVNGNLNITDCQGTGMITGKGNGAVFYGYNGGHIRLYGGTLCTASTSASWGGVAALSQDAGKAPEKGPSSFTMYGGTITGGNVTGKGGSLWAMANCTVTIYGGTITGGKTTADGGNVYLDNKAILKLLGGTIEKGSAVNGNGICVGGTAVSLALGDEPKVDELYLPEGILLQDLDSLTSTAQIGISMEKPGVFATGVTSDLSACFQSTNSAYLVAYSDADQTLKLESNPNVHTHCICGGVGMLGDHTCEEATWEPWTGTWESGKAYYLTEDITLSETIKLSNGQTLSLCLNGFDIQGGKSVTRMFNLFGDLNLCDCKGTGVVCSNYEGTNTQSGRVFYAQTSSTGKGTMRLFGGTLTSNSTTKKGGVGGVAYQFYMYGGTIQGGTATESGGNLSLEAGSMYLYGGTISDGTAPRGSNIAITAGVGAYIADTVITGGSGQLGKSIYMSKNIVLTLAGKLTLADVYLTAGSINADALDPESQIGIAMATPGKFTNSNSVCFLPTQAGFKVTDEGVLEEIA